MAHEDYYYKYGDHMADGTPDTRWQTAPTRLLNRGHDAAADGFMGVLNAGRAVKDFVGNTTFNPLPYGEYAQSAYDGVQNLYGNTLDKAYDSAGSFFRPNRNQYVGPMGNPHDMTGGAGSYDANMPGTMTVADNYIPPKPVGWTPYQEVDTGLNDLRLDKDEEKYQNMVASHYADVREDNSKTQYFPRNGGYQERFEEEQFTKGAIIEAINEDAQNSLPYMTGVLAREADRFDREANNSFTAGFNQGWSDIKKTLSTGKPQTSAWQEWKDSFARGMKAK